MPESAALTTNDMTEKENIKDEEIENDENEQREGTDEEKKPAAGDAAFLRESRNRVKLYVLCEQRVWDDRGTGHVVCVPVGDSAQHSIIVRLESTDKNVLESKILMDTVYQKQQETLIVWSESDTCDLALSFQEKTGCEEIWAKICEVQGRDPGDADGGYDDLDDGELSEGGSGAGGGGRPQLPVCDIAHLPDIEQALQANLATQHLREKMANTIENEKYVAKLCDLFSICEDMEDVDSLRHMYNIAKHLFQLNRNTLVELLLSDEHIKSIIGMLEYDPAHETPRKHREFLWEKARFRQVLPMENPGLKSKIEHTYRVQYLHDVCMPAPSLFEENLLSVLDSFVFFARIDIVTMVQDDKILMKELFTQLKGADTPPERRKDLASFLKEFCHISQHLQPSGPHSKDLFYKCLMLNDVLGTVEPCLMSPDAATRSTIIEMLTMLVDFNSHAVREYLLKQAKDKPESDVLLNRIIEHMHSDKESELASANQVAQVLRTLLDPDNMMSMQKSEKSEFLSFFYTRCIHTLVRPLIENVKSGKLARDDYHIANRQALLIRLLTFCTEHHGFSMRLNAIQLNLLDKVLTLMQSNHHFLALCALKMLRNVVALKDEYYNRHIIKEKLIDRVVNAFVANGPRYNLLNSAILELFEFLRTEDCRTLIEYTVVNHMSRLEDVTYVKTFENLRIRHEQHTCKDDRGGTGCRVASPPLWKERQQVRVRRPTGAASASPSAAGGGRPRLERVWSREEASLPATATANHERDEEWFEQEDLKEEEDEDEKRPTPVIVQTSPLSGRKQGAELMFPSVKKKSGEDDEDGVFGSSGTSVLQPLNPLNKIAIKLDTSRSRSPSPAPSTPSPARDDEVSSSQAGTPTVSSPTGKKLLVEYEDSDSDSDGDGSAGPSASDSKPTSSTGSPAPVTTPSADDDDVSSTSGQEAVDEEKKSRRRRPSDGQDPEAKRAKTESP